MAATAHSCEQQVQLTSMTHRDCYVCHKARHLNSLWCCRDKLALPRRSAPRASQRQGMLQREASSPRVSRARNRRLPSIGRGFMDLHTDMSMSSCCFVGALNAAIPFGAANSGHARAASCNFQDRLIIYGALSSSCCEASLRVLRHHRHSSSDNDSKLAGCSQLSCCFCKRPWD